MRIDKYAPLKPQQFILNLSDADTAAFYQLACRNGTTPAEILTGFICDLIDGTQTRGSDERMYAQQYLDRCGYEMEAQQTFLLWLLKEWRIDDAAQLLETAEDAAGDLAYYEQHPEEADPGFIDDLKATQGQAQQEIADLYKEYAAHMEQLREPAQEMQEATAEVKDYLRQLQTIQQGQ